jgi:hypothetical protein
VKSGGDSGSIGCKGVGSEYVVLGKNVKSCNIGSGAGILGVNSGNGGIGGTSSNFVKLDDTSSSGASRDGGGVIDGALLSA